MKRLLPLLVLASGLAACDEDPTYPVDTWTDPPTEPTVDIAEDAAVDPAADPVPPDGTSDPDAGDPVEDEPAPPGVCERYNADMAGTSDGTWTGDVSTCDPGDMSTEWRNNALKVTNLVRWMAGMPPAELSTSSNAALQECALMMTANGRLSHSPTPDWTCYTAEGAGMAGRSNLDVMAAVAAVGDYMNDRGNDTTFGHRRWILSHGLTSVGFGSTNSDSCMMVSHPIGGSDPEWIAWPPEGEYPYQARYWLGIAFTIQSNEVRQRGATATVTLDGTPLDIETWDLLGGYGSGYAIAFKPSGSFYSVEAGQTYHVEVAEHGISYDVRIVDCDI